MHESHEYLIRWEHLTEFERLAVMEALQDEIDLGHLAIWEIAHGFFLKNQTGVYFMDSDTQH